MDDKAAFDRMFNEWYAQFVYFAYYFVNDVEVCRDIVSDAFEYLWRNYDKIEEVTAKTYLYTIIRTLPKEYRVPFAMHVSGFKYREIAEKLGLPLGTVKSRIFFTRQKLQQELKDFV